MLRTEKPFQRRHRGRKNRSQVAACETEPAREDGSGDFTTQKAVAQICCSGTYL